ncbi:hypothetical protein V2J09_021958 [Rumex salicifolius]
MRLGASCVVDSIGRARGIFVTWDPNSITVQILSQSNHFVRVLITKYGASLQFIFACAPPTVLDVLDSGPMWIGSLLGRRVRLSSGEILIVFFGLRSDSEARASSTQTLGCSKVSMHHLAKLGSDHSPLLLCLTPSAHLWVSHRPFRFEAAWISHPDFLPFIHRA